MENQDSAPAGSVQARQAQLINLAYAQAEAQLRDGTAPPSVVVQLLRMGTIREEMELEYLNSQQELAKAKISAIKNGDRIERLMSEAIAAFNNYGVGASWNNYNDTENSKDD